MTRYTPLAVLLAMCGRPVSADAQSMPQTKFSFEVYYAASASTATDVDPSKEGPITMPPDSSWSCKRAPLLPDDALASSGWVCTDAPSGGVVIAAHCQKSVRGNTATAAAGLIGTNGKTLATLSVTCLVQ